MRGLIKASAYYNNIAARKRHRNACYLTGRTPAEGYEEMGFRRLDKLTEKLLAGTPWEGFMDDQLDAEVKTK